MVPKVVAILCHKAEILRESVVVDFAMSNNNQPSETVARAANAASNKRGPSYTKTEDLLVCKAFIRASEDLIIGTSQKGRDGKRSV